MKKLIILMSILSATSFADTKGNLIKFSANTPAKATEVNENFDDLADAIDTNTASIATKADSSDVTSKADKSYVDGAISDVSTTLTSIQTELSDKADISSNTIYFEKKTLSSNVTTNTNDVNDLRFNNLTVGKFYRVTIQGYLTATAGVTNLLVTSDGNEVCRLQLYNSGTTWVYNAIGTSAVFEAQATTLKFAVSLTGNGMLSASNGVTFATLEELPYHSATTKF